MSAIGKVPLPAGYQFNLGTMGVVPVMEDAEKSKYFLILHDDGRVTWAKESPVPAPAVSVSLPEDRKDTT